MFYSSECQIASSLRGQENALFEKESRKEGYINGNTSVVQTK